MQLKYKIQNDAERKAWATLIKTVAEAGKTYKFSPFGADTYSHIFVGENGKVSDFRGGWCTAGSPVETAARFATFAECVDRLLNPVVEVRITVLKITQDYDAVVHNDGIVIGCQNVSWAKFDELLAATIKARA